MSKITTYTQISDHTKYSSQQKTILELEKKYYTKLLSIFSKQEFLDELRGLMNDINKDGCEFTEYGVKQTLSILQ